MLKKIALLLIFTLLIICNLDGQVTGTTSYQSEATAIKWYKTLDSDGLRESDNTLKKLGNLLMGSDKPIFSRPVSIYASDTANIWIADQGTGNIIHLAPKESIGRLPFGKKEDPLPSLSALCYFQNDEILFSDSSRELIYKKKGKAPYKVFNDSLILQQPTGLAVNPKTTELWILETRAHKVTVTDKNGNLIKTIGQRGSKPGDFNFPTHIWIDSSGDAYIVDAMNFRVQIFDHTGKLKLTFGEQGDATGYFARPKGIATDSRGNIYIADALFHVIQVFNPRGDFLYYFGSQGRSDGEFWMPAGICIDMQDFLYIADSYNSRVQIFKILYNGK